LGCLEGTAVGNIGIGFNRDSGLEVRIDRRTPRSLAELSLAFPIQILDPGIHRLVEEGPGLRRRWLDWGVFHVEHGFVNLWADFSLAMKQRNAALKLGHDPSVWNGEVVRLGEDLAAARRRTVVQLLPIWKHCLSDLLDQEVSLTYYQGWSQERSLAESLVHHLQADKERGSTGLGPHRFDVILTVGRTAARDYLSRGQQKLLGCGMALSMAQLVTAVAKRESALLLDDPAAELDSEKTARLLSAVRRLRGQLIMTSLDHDGPPVLEPDRLFHVEQGRVRSG
jgi:DNA replication and repair protein RecF